MLRGTSGSSPAAVSSPDWYSVSVIFKYIYNKSGFIVAFIAPYLFSYWYVLNHFYNHGGYAWDSGWIAEFIGRPSLTLPLGHTLDVNHYGTWYAYHFSPILAVVSWIGALLPFGPPRLLAIFLGSISGGLGLTVYAALVANCGDRRPLRLLALTTAILSAFSGPALATISSPHYEAAIPALILAFFTLRALGHARWAAFAFAACLLAREDSGLHIALLLGLVALAKAARAGSLQAARDEIRLILIAVAYVVVAVAIQKIWFNGGRLFQIEFAGEPPFAHLTHRRVVQIIGVFLEDRKYIYFPFLVTIMAAALTRSWLLLAGFVSSIPWLVVCLLANFNQIAELIAYYGFPFILGSCWPAVAALIEAPDRVPIPRWRPILIQLAVAATSIVGFCFSGLSPDLHPWKSFRPLPASISVAKTDELVHWIGGAKPRLGRIIAGDGIVALAPDLFESSEWYKWNDEWSPDRFGPADTLVFFRSERLRDVVGRFGADSDVTILEAPKTNIMIVTRRPLSEIAPPAGMLVESCADLPDTVSMARTPSIDASTLMNGWSGQEEQGRWSVAREAYLSFSLCRVPATDLQVDARAEGFVVKGHPAEEVEVLANDIPVARWEFGGLHGGGASRFVIPRAAMKVGTSLRLTFKIGDPQSPAELGLSADPRTLGLFLRSLTIGPVQEK